MAFVATYKGKILFEGQDITEIYDFASPDDGWIDIRIPISCNGGNAKFITQNGVPVIVTLRGKVEALPDDIAR